MNTITSQLPSVTGSFAGLAAQTLAAPDADSSGLPAAPSPAGPDVLSLSSEPSETARQAAAREIALQNRSSILADSSSAFAATAAAGAALATNPQASLASQANLSAASVLSLVGEDA
jgi:hypothetical protein